MSILISIAPPLYKYYFSVSVHGRLAQGGEVAVLNMSSDSTITQTAVNKTRAYSKNVRGLSWEKC